MTLLFYCLSQRQLVRMGLSPAWFPISSQRIGGEPE
jgi:hypothetical protein